MWQKQPQTSQSHGRTRGSAGRAESLHVNNKRPWASCPHVSTQPHTAETPMCWSPPIKEHIEIDTSRQRQRAECGSRSLYIPSHVLEEGNRFRLPRHKSCLAPVSSFPRPYRWNLPKTKKKKKTLFFFSCRCSGQLWLSQWVGWMLFRSLGSGCLCVVCGRTLLQFLWLPF